MKKEVAHNQELTRMVRYSLGLSQTELGNLIEVDRSYIGQLEAGHVGLGMSSIETFYNVCAQNSFLGFPLFRDSEGPIVLPVRQNYSGRFSLGRVPLRSQVIDTIQKKLDTPELQEFYFKGIKEMIR